MKPSDQQKPRKHHGKVAPEDRVNNGPFKIDMPWEDAVKIAMGAGRFFDNCPGIRPGEKTHYGTVEWRQSERDTACLVCPYCGNDAPKDQHHKCGEVRRKFLVPSSARTMARACPASLSESTPPESNT